MKGYILSHDLGTSGNKATLYRADGAMTASTVAGYPLQYPRDGWVEQNPEDWWRAVCLSTKALLEKAGIGAEEVLCVSFSAQMMGCLLVDAAGKHLHPMITWADTRASAEEKRMIAAVGMRRVYEITGHRASASYSAAKLLWVRAHEPEVYAKAYRMLHAKDYIIHRMTGRFVTDYSDASGTNLFDLRKKCWSEELCGAFDIPMRILPDAYPSATVAGPLLPEAAMACGLRAGLPVVIGGGDGSCACVGAGIVEEGSAYCVLGSSSWVSMARREPLFDDDMRTFNWVHLDPELYTPCGTMQSAGLSYSWLHDLLTEGFTPGAKGGSAYDLLNELAEKTSPGADGLLFLPYLLGERSPRWNHAARGCFVGLSASTGKGEMARSVMEGVGMNLKIILDILDGYTPVNSLTMIGGGAKGRLWLQILADIWQKPLTLPAQREEATSLGAAICGGVGIGLYPSFQAAAGMNPCVDKVYPNAKNTATYSRLFREFDAAYNALLPIFTSLADIRTQSEGGEQ